MTHKRDGCTRRHKSSPAALITLIHYPVIVPNHPLTTIHALTNLLTSPTGGVEGLSESAIALNGGGWAV